MDKLSSVPDFDLSRTIQKSTGMDKDVTSIIAEYSEAEVVNLASTIFESREDILKILFGDPNLRPGLSPLIGRLSIQHREQETFIKEFSEIISAAKIKGGEELLERLKADIEKYTDDVSLAINSVNNRLSDRTDKARILLESTSSNYKTFIAERLVLHLLATASESESESSKKETIEGIKRLAGLAKDNERMNLFFKNVFKIIEFNSNVNIDGGISKKSLKLVGKLLSENPNFARILVGVIKPDKLNPDKLEKCISTLLTSDLSITSKFTDQYGIKGKLLLHALNDDRPLRLRLPANFLDKVSLDARGFFPTQAPGLFPIEGNSEKIKRLGDVLIDADFSECVSLFVNSLKDGLVKGTPEEIQFKTLAEEIITLEKDYKKSPPNYDYFMDYPGKGHINVYGTTQAMINKYRDKKVDKDEKKKD